MSQAQSALEIIQSYAGKTHDPDFHIDLLEGLNYGTTDEYCLRFLDEIEMLVLVAGNWEVREHEA